MPKGGVGTPLVQDHTCQFWCDAGCVASASCVAEGGVDPLKGATERVCYLRWRTGVFSKTSSQMWGG